MLLFPPLLSQPQDFHQLTLFLPSSGFLLSVHSWESYWQKLCLRSANLFGALAVCRALEGGVRSWKMSVLSCATSLTSNFFFFFTAAVLLFPPPCWPTFLLSLCPTSVSQYCLCGSFLLFRWRRVLQSVLPLFSRCGDVFEVTLPFCL